MVRFFINELEIFFPYDSVYPEQFAYMKLLKEAMDAEGHGVLEMPTGTGKTVTIFAAVTSYQFRYPDRVKKFLFVTRTVPEMEKALVELSRVVEYRVACVKADITAGLCPEWLMQRIAERMGQKDLGTLIDTNSGEIRLPIEEAEDVAQCLALGMSARRHYCLHPTISTIACRDRLDEACALLAMGHKRQRAEGKPTPPPMSSKDIEDLSLGSVNYQRKDDTPSLHREDGRGRTGCDSCPWYQNMASSAMEPDAEGETEDTGHWSILRVRKRVYSIDEWKVEAASNETPFCPYFGVREVLAACDVIVLNYLYLLDPKVSDMVLGSHPFGVLQKERGFSQNAAGGASFVPVSSMSLTSRRMRGAVGHMIAEAVSQPGAALEVARKGGDASAAGVARAPIVVVMDEAHNLDNVAIEALSVNLTMLVLERARVNIKTLTKKVDEMKKTNGQKLLDEVQQLKTDWLRAGMIDIKTFETLQSPLLAGDRPTGPIPGDIRRAEHFLGALGRLVSYLSKFLSVKEDKTVGPLTFVHEMTREVGIEQRSLKHTYDRLQKLLTTLEVLDVHEFHPLTLVTDVCTLLGTYWQGYAIVVNPYPDTQGIYDPLFELACLDASLGMRSITNAVQTCVITSGTISPLHLYPQVLGFTPVVMKSLPMSLDRNCFCPIVISRGIDQVPLSSRFDMRRDVSVIRNYGQMILALCKIVPDGVICFFTSYSYMETVMAEWYSCGILADILGLKLISMETKDVVSTTLALHNYRKACDSGRGAIFFSIARGKVSEGIDFDKHYGRAVVMIGIPYQYTLSRTLKAKLDFLKVNHNVGEAEWLTFDAMRQAAQCVGRVIRSKLDYGLMIFADARYARQDKRSKLPEWIRSQVDMGNLGLGTDDAMQSCNNFLLQMAQEFDITENTRWDQKTLDRMMASGKLGE